MIKLPAVELLESRHAFPCHYTFKVIGSAEENFTARVVACVRDLEGEHRENQQAEL